MALGSVLEALQLSAKWHQARAQRRSGIERKVRSPFFFQSGSSSGYSWEDVEYAECLAARTRAVHAAIGTEIAISEAETLPMPSSKFREGSGKGHSKNPRGHGALGLADVPWPPRPLFSKAALFALA